MIITVLISYLTLLPHNNTRLLMPLPQKDTECAGRDYQERPSGRPAVGPRHPWLQMSNTAPELPQFCSISTIEWSIDSSN